MRPSYQVTELLGDGIGPELSRAIHRLALALPIDLEFIPVDFSLENRRRNAENHLRRGRGKDYRHPGGAQAPDDHRRREPERHPEATARAFRHPPAGLHHSRRSDQFSPRAGRGYRPHRHRRNLRRPWPHDRPRRSRQPPHRRARARARGGALRLQPRQKDREKGHQLLEIHDPEGDRRPFRAGRPGSRRPASPRFPTPSSSSTHSWARSSWPRKNSRSCSS